MSPQQQNRSSSTSGGPPEPPYCPASTKLRITKFLPLVAAFVLGYICCSLVMFNQHLSFKDLFSSFSDDSEANSKYTSNDDVMNGGGRKKFPPKYVAAPGQEKSKHQSSSAKRFEFVSGEESTKHFFQQQQKQKELSSLDFFLLIQDSSPRSILGDVDVKEMVDFSIVVADNNNNNTKTTSTLVATTTTTTAKSSKNQNAHFHLYSVNNDEGGALWPNSLAGKIKEIPHSAREFYSKFVSPLSFSPMFSHELQQKNNNNDNNNNFCTPHKFVGIFGENVKMNSSVVDFLNNKTAPSSNNNNNNNNPPFGCKIFFTETINLLEVFSGKQGQASLSKFVGLYNQFFDFDESANALLEQKKNENDGQQQHQQHFMNHIPYGFNFVLPQSEFVQLSEFVSFLLKSSSLEAIQLVPSHSTISGATSSSAKKSQGSGSGATENNNNNNNSNNNEQISNTDKLHLAVAVFFAIRFKNHRYDAGFEHLSLLGIINPQTNAPHPRILSQKRINDVADSLSEAQRKIVRNIAEAFRVYDENPSAVDIFPVFATMCVGVDCMVAEDHFDSLRGGMGVGYFVFVLNARDPNIHKRFTSYRHAFPGRFILRDPGRKLSCAESWNVILKICFEQLSIPVPFVVIVNADFIVTNSRHRVWNSWMRENDNEKLLRFPMVQYHHFYTFAYTKFGWDVVGTFDENVYPAYGEDVEMVYRSVSLKLYPYPEFGDWNNHHRHVGSMSLKDNEVSAQVGRFDRADYNMRKWNVNLYCCGGAWMAASVFERNKPYPHPFNLKHVPHRSGWSFDAAHRRCVVTAQGNRIHNQGAMCWFNVSTILDKYPDPEGRSPEQLFSKKQLGFAPG